MYHSSNNNKHQKFHFPDHTPQYRRLLTTPQTEKRKPATTATTWAILAERIFICTSCGTLN